MWHTLLHTFRIAIPAKLPIIYLSMRRGHDRGKSVPTPAKALLGPAQRKIFEELVEGEIW